MGAPQQHPMAQPVDIYRPMMATREGPAPITLRIGTIPHRTEMVGAVPANPVRVETYVLLNALPEELKRRVEMAIQAALAGM